jgi:hypothetical protein
MFRFIPLDKLNKNRRYEIVGVPKCGTTSLAEYMRKKGFDVEESELQFFDIHKAHTHDYYFRTPIIVVRNPIERAWSDYNFFERDSIEKACDFSFYQYGLQMWDSLIYSLEYLMTIPDFPKLNYNKNKSILTNDIKKNIIKELKL